MNLNSGIPSPPEGGLDDTAALEEFAEPLPLSNEAKSIEPPVETGALFGAGVGFGRAGAACAARGAPGRAGNGEATDLGGGAGVATGGGAFS